MNISESELESVIIIFRHGERVPSRVYKNDPYNNLEFWPVGWGQLTDKGKETSKNLGIFLRERYENLFLKEHKKEQIYVQSTKVQRTIDSAVNVLRGIYPEGINKNWEEEIITVPEKKDALLAMERKCRKYKKINKKRLKKAFKTLLKENTELFEKLSFFTGEKINNLKIIEKIYRILQVERDFYNFLPKWTEYIYKKLEPFQKLYWECGYSSTKEMARLKCGIFYKNLIEHYFKIINNLKTQKILLFSGHHTTLINLMQSLDVFDYDFPPYSSCLIFELRKNVMQKFYVNVYYKKGEHLEKVCLKNQKFDLDFDVFCEILNPITVSLEEWKVECRSVGKKEKKIKGQHNI